MWGKVGLIGLASRDLEELKAFRDVIELQRAGRTRFALFPKDSLNRKGNLSVLLRENYKDFNIKYLAKGILLRARMRGGLRVTHVKKYRPYDRTRNGTSKEGWRLVLLEGCPRFMTELSKFDLDHRFPVGAGHVIIRGGQGRPRGTLENRGRRSRGDDQQQQQHQYRGRPQSTSATGGNGAGHQSGHHGGQHGRNTERRRDDEQTESRII